MTTTTPLRGTAEAAPLVWGARVRTERLAQDLTQRDLAQAAGVTQTFISRLERGADPQDTVDLLKVADVLGIAASEMFPRRRRLDPAPIRQATPEREAS